MPQAHRLNLFTKRPIDQWRCPKCGLPMFLACIEPAVEVDYERRTFECSTCPYGETITVDFRIDRGDGESRAFFILSLGQDISGKYREIPIASTAQTGCCRCGTRNREFVRENREFEPDLVPIDFRMTFSEGTGADRARACWTPCCPGNICFRPLRSPGGVNNYKLRRPLGCVIRKVRP
jgi:hypothetical protein